MRILIVATKSPWPPRDGGRLALWLTMKGLAEAGHELTLVAPVEAVGAAASQAMTTALKSICTPQLVVVERRSWIVAGFAAVLRKCSLSVARHQLAAVDHAVAQCLQMWRPDVVHVEQLQALANCRTASAARAPIVLRMQNVESSLWYQVARARPWSWPLLLEARRLRRDETRAMRRVERVVALTERDALVFRTMFDNPQAARINAVCPPFPVALASAEQVEGAPAVVLAGSTGWWPNTDGLRWFIQAVAPLLVTALPTTRVHVYGGAAINRPYVDVHAAPADAVPAFPAGAIAVIPLRIGSGIRMRILEAWARGLPVVATTVAAAGLQVESGRELLIADTPRDFAQAIVRLAQDAQLRTAMVDAGRAYLAHHHNSEKLTESLVAKYVLAIAGRA